ncbi:MAG: flagellar biosynthesis protein FlhB [Desulfobulbaceae bacterium]|nr:flagellar biosynthesis protein FlhB [Desulfobulbaceae bacterium]
MAEESSGQEKTEEPTSRRLAEARKKGDVAKSMEVPSAAVLLAALITIYALSGYMVENCSTLMRHYLGNLHTVEIIPDNMVMMVREGMFFSMKLVGPVMAVVILVALLANYAQVGVLFSTEKLAPKLSKIDPIQGVAKMFSMQTLANTVKSIAKVMIIGYVAYSEVLDVLPEIPPLMDQSPGQIMTFIGRVSFWIFLKSVLVIVILAAFDYVFQKWQFMKKMKMTKQEVKEEAKQTEGDPQVKGRIRAIQMEMARRRMMEEVPSADVVITNPTRLSIALKYDSASMTSPTIVAKGAGVIAQRIREIAMEHNVPLVEDKPLAQALYKTVEVGETVPENLYQAVAEVLAYVYSQKRKAA